LVNIWTNFTPIGWIIKKIGILDNNLTILTEIFPEFRCNDDLVEHLSLYYNKSEISDNFSFVRASKFARNYPRATKDDKISCWMDLYECGADYSLYSFFEWNFDRTWKKCENNHSKNNCEQ
jgi:hypothetical protein